VNVYLPRRLMQQIDRFAGDTGLNRSAFFGLAARRYLEAEKKQLRRPQS
jgi:metal-responsive CopG/Arc/MetJ family transcriptional regulator